MTNLEFKYCPHDYYLKNSVGRQSLQGTGLAFKMSNLEHQILWSQQLVPNSSRSFARHTLKIKYCTHTVLDYMNAICSHARTSHLIRVIKITISNHGQKLVTTLWHAAGLNEALGNSFTVQIDVKYRKDQSRECSWWWWCLGDKISSSTVIFDVKTAQKWMGTYRHFAYHEKVLLIVLACWVPTQSMHWKR